MKIEDITSEKKDFENDVYDLTDNTIEEIEDQMKTLKRNFDYKIMYQFMENDTYFVHYSINKRDYVIDFVKNKMNRKPTDTPEEIHNVLDDALEKEFGIRYRSQSIFVYPLELSLLQRFDESAKRFIIIPKKPWSLLYSKTIADFFVTFNDTRNIIPLFFDLLDKNKSIKILNDLKNEFSSENDQAFIDELSILINSNSLDKKTFYNSYTKNKRPVEVVRVIRSKLFDVASPELVKNYYKETTDVSEIESSESSLEANEVMIYSESFGLLDIGKIHVYAKYLRMVKGYEGNFLQIFMKRLEEI